VSTHVAWRLKPMRVLGCHIATYNALIRASTEHLLDKCECILSLLLILQVNTRTNMCSHVRVCLNQLISLSDGARKRARIRERNSERPESGVRVRVCGCVYADMCVRGYVCMRMCVCGCVYADVCMRMCVRGCVYADVWMRGCVHACMRGCVHAWMRACVHACMRACVHAW
jgi:hypothetical protein